MSNATDAAEYVRRAAAREIPPEEKRKQAAMKGAAQMLSKLHTTIAAAAERPRNLAAYDRLLKNFEDKFEKYQAAWLAYYEMYERNTHNTQYLAELQKQRAEWERIREEQIAWRNKYDE